MIGQVPLQMLIPHTDTVSQSQQNMNQRTAIENSQAMQTMQRHVEQAKDTVIPKDTLELHDYQYDASKEGNQKYQDRRKKKQYAEGQDTDDKEPEPVHRVNFDIQV